MKITEKYIKVITLGETYLDDEMRSQRRFYFIKQIGWKTDFN